MKYRVVKVTADNTAKDVQVRMPMPDGSNIGISTVGVVTGVRADLDLIDPPGIARPLIAIDGPPEMFVEGAIIEITLPVA